jgi:Zn ribbon nucleic-acid-binding protein
MTFIAPEFCPFCGMRTLLDQGGSDEVKQLQCAKCSAFFNLQVIDSPNEEAE